MSDDRWASRVLEAINKLADSPSNTWNQSVNYAGLPDASTVPGETWLVLVGTGIWPVSKPSGWYYSDGSTWLYLGAYNPVVSGGNVTVANLPQPASTGEGITVVVPPTGIQLIPLDSTRKGFVLTLEAGIVYVGLGFTPTDSQYTYRMTKNSVVEKDGYIGPVFACTDESPQEIYITEIK